MARDEHLELLYELRKAASSIGASGLTALLQGARGHGELELDAATLEKFLALLMQLIELQELPYVAFDRSSILRSEKNSNVHSDEADLGAARLYDYLDVERSRSIDSEYEDSNIPTPIGEEKPEDSVSRSTLDVERSGSVDSEYEDSIIPSRIAEEKHEEVIVSNQAFDELYPHEGITEKKTLAGSFPNIENFDGGFRVIGEGFSGLTFKTMLRGVPVVLKASKERSERSNRVDYHEWSISERLNSHPNVLEVIGLCPSFTLPTYSNLGTTTLISPLQENGGLKDFLAKREPRPNDILDIALGMIQGIRSLHRQGAVHRDIAVRNFLVDNDGRVMLCDFGLTEFLPDGKSVLQHRDLPEQLPVPWRRLAPEAFDGIFSAKTDIWMYGLALIELVTNREPWPTCLEPSDLLAMLKERKKDKRLKEDDFPDMAHLPPVLADIVRGCCELDPSARLTPDDIVRMIVLWRVQCMCTYTIKDKNDPLEALASAAAHGNLDVVKIVVDHFPTFINERVRDRAPLDLAALKGHLEVVKYLVALPSIEVNIAAKDGYTPLHRAAAQGHTEVVKILVALPNVDANGAFNLGRTPIQRAAKEGHVEVVEFLASLENIDPSTPNHSGWTMMHGAARGGHVDVVNYLLTLPNNNASAVDIIDGHTPMHCAAGWGNIDVVQRLARVPGVDANAVDKTGRTALHLASSRRDIDRSASDIVKFLASLPSVDANAATKGGCTPMHLSARCGNVSVVNCLSALPNINVNASDNDGLTPIHYAAKEGRVDVVTCLVCLPNVDTNAADKHGFTAMHHAAKLGLIDVVECLTNLPNFDVNAVDNEGRTAMHHAAFEGSRDLMKVLVKHPGIDANAVDNTGKAPLHLAARQGHTRVVKFLGTLPNIEANATDHDGCTAMHLALLGGSWRCADVINCLSSVPGIDVNAADRSGYTALHRAAEQGQSDVVKALAALPAVDVNAITRNGETAADLAEVRGHAKVLRLL